MADAVQLGFRRDTFNADAVRASVYEDAPEYKNYGDYHFLRDDQIVELLQRLGKTSEEAQNIVESLADAPSNYRLQVRITPEQERYLRTIFCGEW